MLSKCSEYVIETREKKFEKEAIKIIQDRPNSFLLSFKVLLLCAVLGDYSQMLKTRKKHFKNRFIQLFNREIFF